MWHLHSIFTLGKLSNVLGILKMAALEEDFYSEMLRGTVGRVGTLLFPYAPRNILNGEMSQSCPLDGVCTSF